MHSPTDSSRHRKCLAFDTELSRTFRISAAMSAVSAWEPSFAIRFRPHLELRQVQFGLLAYCNRRADRAGHAPQEVRR